MIEDKTRPATPTLDKDIPNVEVKSDVEVDISARLGEEGVKENKVNSNEPVSVKPNIVDLNNLSKEQVQNLQELFANTPRRVKSKDNFYTVELRQIGGKIVVEWGKSYLDLKTDTTLRKDVMKTMIPIRFHGETDFVDILWKEDFIGADKVTCRILKMEKQDDPIVVGKTLKRDNDGGYTSQEVEMYVNKVIITLTVQLPNGEEAIIDGSVAN